ncbi:MAG: hypothetical protein Q4D98_05480 [Planctomycetia bacterium]|nr:hypothetical protein [Planctomycetia bacterium]
MRDKNKEKWLVLLVTLVVCGAFAAEVQADGAKKGLFNVFSRKSSTATKTATPSEKKSLFGGLFGEKKTPDSQGVPQAMPAEDDLPDASRVGEEIILSDEVLEDAPKTGTPQPVSFETSDKKPPFEPSYGVDRSEETTLREATDVLEEKEVAVEKADVSRLTEKDSEIRDLPKRPDLPRLELDGEDELEKAWNYSPQRLAPMENVGAEDFRSDYTSADTSLPPIPQEGESLGIQGRFGSQVNENRLPELSDDLSDEVADEFRHPALEIRTLGPQCIVIGTEAKYEVVVCNVGQSVSDDTVVNVEIPSWMDVVGTNVRVGAIEMKESLVAGGHACVWNLGTLQSRETQSLELKLVPRQKASARLNVTWTNKQLSSQRQIQVEEPQLTVEILGGDALILGRKETLTLKISNTGNCIAEEIGLRVLQKETGEELFVLRSFGKLYPDEEREQVVEFLPRRPGATAFVAEATIQNRPVAASEKRSEVRFANISLNLKPETESFVAMETSWKITVRNEGNTAATGARVKVELPSSLRFLSSDAVQPPIATSTGVLWNLDKIEPGDVKTFTMKVRAEKEGSEVVRGMVLTDYLATVTQEVPVAIQAIADVRMTLNVPKRVVTMGDLAPCEIKLSNTGSLPIRDAKLFVFFADGIEPKSASGGASITDRGVVVFEVPPFQPGDAVTFHVTSEASRPGNYPIRCQLRSEESRLDLIQQDTTLFR